MLIDGLPCPMFVSGLRFPSLLSIVDSLETLLEDWETSLCREYARDFLAPYVVVQPTQVGDLQTGAAAESLHVTEANPQITAVSVVRRLLDLTAAQREGFEDFDPEVMPSAYGLLLVRGLLAHSPYRSCDALALRAHVKAEGGILSISYSALNLNLTEFVLICPFRLTCCTSRTPRPGRTCSSTGSRPTPPTCTGRSGLPPRLRCPPSLSTCPTARVSRTKPAEMASPDRYGSCFSLLLFMCVFLGCTVACAVTSPVPPHTRRLPRALMSTWSTWINDSYS